MANGILVVSIKDVIRSSVKVPEFGGHIGRNNKDEDNSLKTLNDNNHQASSQKFRQLIELWFGKKTEEIRNQRKNQDYPNYIIVEIG